MRVLPILVASALVAAATTIVPATAASATANVAITGTVLAAADGAAIGTRVNWVSPASGASGDSVLSDSTTGAFSLTVPASAKSFYLTANLDDSGATVTNGYTGEFVGASNHGALAYQLIAPYSTAQTSTVKVALERVGSITGTSRALAGQIVELDALDSSYIDDAIVSSSGGFRFADLAPGLYRLSCAGEATSTYRDYTSPVVSVRAGKITTVTPTLLRGATISGTVTLRHKPLRNVFVGIFSPGYSVFKVATTDAKGRYSIAGLPTASLTLAVASMSKSTTGTLAYTHMLARVKAGGSAKVNVALTPAGGVKGTITGHAKKTLFVSFARGKTSIPGEFVSSSSKSVKVAQAGLAAGTYTVYAVEKNGSRYGKGTVKIVAGKVAKLPKIKLNHATVTLKGTVAGKVSGTVTASDLSRGLDAEGKLSKGAFTIKGIIPGTSRVVVAAAGYADASKTLTLKHSTKHAFSKGAKLGTVTGTVFAGGVAQADSIVEFEGSGDDDVQVTSSKGIFSSRLSPGRYDLSFMSFSTPFPERTPFYLASPISKVTVSAGTTTALGTIALRVLGGL